MKKTLLISALALATLTATAATFEPGKSGKTTLQDLFPVNTDFSNSGCQSLFTSDELHPDLWKVESDGTIKAAKITSLSLDVTFTSNLEYYVGATDITVYLQNTDALAFQQIGTSKNYSFIPYEETYVGHGTISDEDLEWIAYGGGDVTVTVTFDTPFEYKGESILLTWINETENPSYYAIDNDSLWGFKPGDSVRTLYTGNNSNNPFLDLYETGYTDNTSKYLPSITFDYDTYEIKNGPVIERGEAAEFEVGNFDAPIIEKGSTGDFMPFDGAYKNSLSQALYTENELKGLNKISDNGEITKAEIQEVTFLVSAADDIYFYYGETFETSVYVQNTDETEFKADNSGTYHWKEYSNEYKGTVEIDFSGEEWEMFAYWGEGGLIPVTIKLDNPILYEGKSLLFTFETEADCNDENWINATAALLTQNKQAVNTSKDRSSIANIYAETPKNNWSYVPVLKLNYVPVTEKGGETVIPVSFDNVTLGLVEIEKKVGSNEKGNAIQVSFEINDPSNCGSYEIKAGTTSLGKISDTKGTITYMNIPAGDVITLNVVPAGEGTIGVPYEIKKAEFEALFPAPEMEVTKTAFADYSYDLAGFHKRGTEITTDAAAQFYMTNWEAAPVSQFNRLDLLNPSDKNITTLGSASGSFADLVTDNSSDYKDVQGNLGYMSMQKKNAITVTIADKTGVVESYSNGYLYFTFAVDYPLYYSATPALGESDVEEIETRIVQRQYDNGQSYGKTQLRADFKFSELTNPGTVTVNHPAEITHCNKDDDDDPDFIRIAGPEGTTLRYKKIDYFDPKGGQKEEEDVPSATADDAEETDENGFTIHKNVLPYLVLDKEEYKGSTIHVQAYTADGEFHSFQYINVASNGDISTGISDVIVEGDGKVEFYNLQGVRVDGTLTPGIYVRREGNKATKVLVK